MISLKKIDCIFQTLFLVSALAIILLFDNSWFFAAYFILGAWQVMSVVVTKLFAANMPSVFHRGYYLKTLLVLAGIGLLAFAIPQVGFYFFYGLLFISPLLAVWYIIITWLELQLWQKRKLVHLK